jgi:hypothetical protein
MRITVRPRTIAAPWDHESLRRIVGLEADVQPDPSVLARYDAEFPHREVRWDYSYQSWAIWRCEPGEVEQLHERLTYWDAAPDPATGQELTDEQISAMAGKDARIIRRFMPFDHQFVERRLRERMTFLGDGEAKYQRRLADRNAARGRTFVRDHARSMAAAWNEVKAWAPVLDEFQRTGRWHPGQRRAMARGAVFTPPTPALSTSRTSLLVSLTGS